MKVMYQKSSKFKKTFAVLMCMLMTASMFYANIINSNALEYTNNNITYTLNSPNEGEAQVSYYVSYLFGDFVIPSTINNGERDYSVTSIGDNAFAECKGLTSVTIPGSVTSIGGAAFYGCNGLTSVTIPDSVTSIGGAAFSDCTGLTSVTIPGSVTSIGNNAFAVCIGLTSVTIPDSVTAIGDSVFYYCTGLTSVTIPDSVTSIGEAAFFGCTGLTSVTIPDSVTAIGKAAFRRCTSLTSVTIPDSVTAIGNSTFYDCTGLTSVTIPASVTAIGDSVFSGCAGLTSVTIPGSVTAIGGSAFYRCRSLTSVTIPGSVTSIGDNAFAECKSLTSVTIPGSVTSIDDLAFYDCTGLTSVTIPASVTSIGNGAFMGCTGLTSVTIPASVTSIGNGAFYGCTNLSKIYIPEDFDFGVFSSNNSCINPKKENTKYDIEEGYPNGDFIVQRKTKRTITYKNYDGSDIKNLPENYPTTYTEGQELTLPTDSPDSAMSGYAFLGFWDCPLDQSKKVTVPGSGYEDEQSLDLTVGNKITKISDSSTGDVTLYARYTLDVFDEDVNGRENYIFGAPGVFPNGSTASMRVLEPGTEEYANTLQHVDNKDVNNVKIVEFQVLNSQGEMVQPNTFFGDAVIGFKIPDGFNEDDISLIRVVANGEDITLRSKIWVDPDNPDLKYIEGTTNHFSPYAILSPWNENIVETGDNTWITLIGASTISAISAGIFILMSRKKKSEKV